MANLTEIIARAEQIAVGKGVDPHDSPVLDAGLTVEALYPHALRYAVGRDLRSGGSPLDYLREYALVVSGGEATLPDSVIRSLIAHSNLKGVAISAYVPYPDYARSPFSTWATYYSVRGGTFLCATNQTLVTPGLPDEPADATTDITMSPKLEADVIMTLAGALTGEIPVRELLTAEI